MLLTDHECMKESDFTRQNVYYIYAYGSCARVTLQMMCDTCLCLGLYSSSLQVPTQVKQLARQTTTLSSLVRHLMVHLA